jgi:hypothetical protein
MLSAGTKRVDGWLAEVADDLVPVDIEGTTAYVVREDADTLAAARPTQAVRLLPGHDQWVMAPGTDDTRVVPAACRQAVTRKANLILVGGVVRGTWAVRGDDLALTWADDGRSPQAVEEAVVEEVRRLAEILGRPRSA